MKNRLRRSGWVTKWVIKLGDKSGSDEAQDPVQQMQNRRMSLFHRLILKDWANIVLCDRLFKGIQEELFVVYSNPDAMKIYCISLLRVCNPGIKDYELKEAYETSFLSEIYPGIALSRNTVSSFLNDLGKTCSRIVLFMRNRTAAVSMDHHLLVDGTLKSDESSVNSLSEFSRKARTKGTRDISVLYAFDLEEMEPVLFKQEFVRGVALSGLKRH